MRCYMITTHRTAVLLALFMCPLRYRKSLAQEGTTHRWLWRLVRKTKALWCMMPAEMAAVQPLQL